MWQDPSAPPSYGQSNNPAAPPGYGQFNNPAAPPGYDQFNDPSQQQQFGGVYSNMGPADGAYTNTGIYGENDQKMIGDGHQGVVYDEYKNELQKRTDVVNGLDPMIDDEEPFNGVVEKRTRTDTKLLIFMAIFMVLIIICSIICLSTSTERTILKDSCGNVCGDVNENELNTCGESADKTNEKFLANIDSVIQCVAVCPETTKASEMKICKDETKEASLLNSDTSMPWGKVACGMAISTAFSIIMALLFRYSTRGFVWVTLISKLIACVFLTIYLWISIGFNTLTFLVFIYTILFLFIIAYMFKGIQFIIVLFEETGKATWSMPALFLQPLLTLVSIIIATVLFIFLLIATSKTDRIVEPSPVIICDSSVEGHDCEYDSSKDGLTVRDLDLSTFQIFSLFLTIVGFIWMIEFIVHCQYYITANSISYWFFTRDKLSLEAPIKRSYRNLWKYHLGTIAFGSLVITAVRLLRCLIKRIKASRNRSLFLIATLLDCCVRCFESLLVYLTRNAYVITAIHGYGYWKSGEKAFHYLTSNVLNILKINELGGSVLCVAQCLIVLLTVCVGKLLFETNDTEGLAKALVGIFFMVIFSWFTTSCFVSIIDMTVDTLYICFCVDCKHNNGEDRPYFMSVSMMEFMEVNKRFAIEKENAQRIKNGMSGTAV